MPKTWFITGSSRGLGRAIATFALDEGDRVVATARNPNHLADMAERYGDNLLAVELDVTDPGNAEAAAAATFERFGQLDVLVNNAGYSDLSSVEDATLEDFRAQVETNFFGVVNVTKTFLPRLRQQGHGHIFQVSSVGGRVGTPGQAAYQSSKWAVGGFSTALAREVAPLGIQITVLEPGSMPTGFTGSSMTVRPISAPYEMTVGMVAASLSRRDADDSVEAGVRPADLRMIASVIADLAGRADAPVRLLLGADATSYAASAAEGLTDSDQAWREVSLSVTPTGPPSEAASVDAGE